MTFRAMAARAQRGGLAGILSGLSALTITTFALADDPPAAEAPAGNDASSAIAPASSPLASAPQPLPDDAVQVDVRYGYQTLAVDGAAFAILLSQLAVSSTSPARTWIDSVGTATFVAGGPIVHVAHRHQGKALASLGLRFGMPLVLGAIGAGAMRTGEGKDLDRSESTMVGILAGVTLGALGASVLDAALLARERVPAPTRDTVGAVTSVIPTVSVLPHGATLGVAGTIF